MLLSTMSPALALIVVAGISGRGPQLKPASEELLAVDIPSGSQVEERFHGDVDVFLSFQETPHEEVRRGEPVWYTILRFEPGGSPAVFARAQVGRQPPGPLDFSTDSAALYQEYLADGQEHTEFSSAPAISFVNYAPGVIRQDSGEVFVAVDATRYVTFGSMYDRQLSLKFKESYVFVFSDDGTQKTSFVVPNQVVGAFRCGESWCPVGRGFVDTYRYFLFRGESTVVGLPLVDPYCGPKDNCEYVVTAASLTRLRCADDGTLRLLRFGVPDAAEEEISLPLQLPAGGTGYVSGAVWTPQHGIVVSVAIPGTRNSMVGVLNDDGTWRHEPTFTKFYGISTWQSSDRGLLLWHEQDRAFFIPGQGQGRPFRWPDTGAMVSEKGYCDWLLEAGPHPVSAILSCMKGGGSWTMERVVFAPHEK